MLRAQRELKGFQRELKVPKAQVLRVLKVLRDHKELLGPKGFKVHKVLPRMNVLKKTLFHYKL